ncbi:putative sensor histidine kinase TcrY [Nonomuraea coxensis DSM 45129]|uniref:histidine kinase n=1 Tax=Nonomuraea coxensis DSM 45129 TaxID=1122611 RepID=A0ABX8TSG0_9ACTN|nr:HAMP domain-containing sensor histidine kinase [Nonomuraea coxensis]QYC38406.1 putative sensor histidine kinase TcrY [Nonomuraea coxensis DSM 45129]
MKTGLGHSLRGRLALYAAIVMLLLNVVVSAFVLWGVRSQAATIHGHETSSRALFVLLLVKRDQLSESLPANGLDGIQVLDPAGRPVASTPNLAGQPRQTDLVPRQNMANDVAEEVCDLPAFPGSCKTVAGLVAYQPDGDYRILAFSPSVPWYVSPRTIIFQACITALLVALSYFGVSHIVAKALAPVSRITRRLADITASGGGGLRLPVTQHDDEIRDLAVTGNHMLERLEEAMRQQDLAMERQRRFATDASHDLRSPITAMRTQVEDALLHPEDADWPATGREVLTSLDRLQAIVGDLLTLTKLDSGAPSSREPVDLGALAATEAARPRAKRVITSLQPDVVVSGDQLQLVRLLTNLLDNAERHAEQQILVTVRRQDGQAVLEVLDDGAGIAPEHREMVFQRFTRLDASRSRDAGGTGLGLPIAREIAHAHGGSLAIEDSDVGARFVLRLPVLDGC